MSIASRLEAIEEHLSDAYDSIEAKGANLHLLPSEYTQVDYIESSGTQYIDLNETATIDCEMGIDCYLPTYDSGNRSVMGCRKNGCSAIIGLQPKLVYQFGNMTAPVFTSNIALNKRRKIVANNTGCYVDGKLFYGYSGTSSVKESSNHIKLFATSDSNDSIEFYANTGTKMYSAYIKKNGVYTRNLIPCYRNSDNEVGLYDIVNDVFYTNQGTDAFTYGEVKEDYAFAKNISNLSRAINLIPTD